MYWQFKNEQSSFYHKVYTSPKLAHILSVSGFIFTLVVIFSPIKTFHSLQNRVWPEWLGAFYVGVARPLFVFLMALTFAGSMTGQHTLIRYLFGGEFWGALARLNFVAYILHLAILTVFYGNQHISGTFEHTPILFIFFSITLITYLISVPFSTIFEAPFIQIERFFLLKQKKELKVKEEKFDPLLNRTAETDE